MIKKYNTFKKKFKNGWSNLSIYFKIIGKVCKNYITRSIDEIDFYDYAEFLVEKMKPKIFEHFGIDDINIELNFYEETSHYAEYLFNLKYDLVSQSTTNLNDFYLVSSSIGGDTKIRRRKYSPSEVKNIRLIREKIVIYIRSIYNFNFKSEVMKQYSHSIRVMEFFEDVVNSLAHEVCHAKQIRIYPHEDLVDQFINTISSKEDYEAYFNQKAEIEAREQSKEFVAKNIDFINNYSMLAIKDVLDFYLILTVGGIGLAGVLLSGFVLLFN